MALLKGSLCSATKGKRAWLFGCSKGADQLWRPRRYLAGKEDRLMFTKPKEIINGVKQVVSSSIVGNNIFEPSKGAAEEPQILHVRHENHDDCYANENFYGPLRCQFCKNEGEFFFFFLKAKFILDYATLGAFIASGSV